MESPLNIVFTLAVSTSQACRCAGLVIPSFAHTADLVSTETATQMADERQSEKDVMPTCGGICGRVAQERACSQSKLNDTDAPKDLRARLTAAQNMGWTAWTSHHKLKHLADSQYMESKLRILSAWQRPDYRLQRSPCQHCAYR